MKIHYQLRLHGFGINTVVDLKMVALRNENPLPTKTTWVVKRHIMKIWHSNWVENARTWNFVALVVLVEILLDMAEISSELTKISPNMIEISLDFLDEARTTWWKPYKEKCYLKTQEDQFHWVFIWEPYHSTLDHQGNQHCHWLIFNSNDSKLNRFVRSRSRLDTPTKNT